MSSGRDHECGFVQSPSRTQSIASTISQTSWEFSLAEQFPLFPRDNNHEIHKSLHENVLRSIISCDNEGMITCVQLDADTVAQMFSLGLISHDDRSRLRDTSKTTKDRILDYLIPILRSSGNRGLEKFYQVLMVTKEGRLGHQELAKALKRKVTMYTDKVNTKKKRYQDGLSGLKAKTVLLLSNLNFSLLEMAARKTNLFSEETGKMLTAKALVNKREAVNVLMSVLEETLSGYSEFLKTLQVSMQVEGASKDDIRRHALLIGEQKRTTSTIREVSTNSKDKVVSHSTSPLLEAKVLNLEERVAHLESAKDSERRCSHQDSDMSEDIDSLQDKLYKKDCEIGKEKDAHKLTKAALNACRKRIKSLEGSLQQDSEEEQTYNCASQDNLLLSDIQTQMQEMKHCLLKVLPEDQVKSKERLQLHQLRDTIQTFLNVVDYKLKST